jgi:hypothetical protein
MNHQLAQQIRKYLVLGALLLGAGPGVDLLNPKQAGLAADTQFVATVNHLSALSNPALVSAPLKTLWPCM